MTNGPDPRAAREFAEWLRNREHYPENERDQVPDEPQPETASGAEQFAAMVRGAIHRRSKEN